jgi:hypothetical protein
MLQSMAAVWAGAITELCLTSALYIGESDTARRSVTCTTFSCHDVGGEAITLLPKCSNCSDFRRVTKVAVRGTEERASVIFGSWCRGSLERALFVPFRYAR